MLPLIYQEITDFDLSRYLRYVGLLEGTLVGFLLPAWIESKKRKAIKTGKFYFFDPGITHMLAGTETLDRNSNLYGNDLTMTKSC